ncbi:MAG TPA: FkbM family methyltransferase [Alphaproteobacteria bacterium]
MVRRLPRRARDVALKRLAESNLGYRLFRKLGQLYRVQDIGVFGEYGLIEGAFADAGVLQIYARSGGWARTAMGFFRDIFERAGAGTYIDIGANIGLTTIPIARNPRVACKAFEPAPRNFGYMERNVRANCPHGNVELFAMALFDRRATLEFALSSENSGDNRVRIDGAAPPHAATTVQIAAERLDDVLDPASLPRPIAVKLVAQGAEGRIIAGGQRVLREAEAMLLEFDPGLILQIEPGIEATTAFLGAQFRQAAFATGRLSEINHAEHRLDWRPTAEIIGEMRTKFGQARAPGLAYDYIYARR